MLYVLPANHCLLGLLSRQPRSVEKLVEGMVTLQVSHKLLHALIRNKMIMFMCILTVSSWYPNFRKVSEF